MQYLKCKKIKSHIFIALKENYKMLTSDEKRTVRKENAWCSFSKFVSAVIFFSVVIAGIYTIKLIPQPNWWLWSILVNIGKVLIAINLCIISGVLAYVLTKPLWKKIESFNSPRIKKEAVSKACAYLRDFYGLSEPYIVTKCFDATDKNFKDQDVCIFVFNDELRITVDLMKGFLDGKKDLGCYTFKRNEITLSKQQNGKQLILELKADDSIFLLGYRAKGFIKRNFIDESE